MKSRSKVVLTIFFTLTLLAVAVVVKAQETSAPIFEKQTQTKRIAELTTAYRNQVEEYRRLEQEFGVARTQFEQVGSLSSLENAVRKTKAVMISRANVLKLYLELLQAILNDTSGVNLTRRETESQAISAILIDLSAHLQILDTTNDREAISQRADEFDQFSKQIVSTAQKASALIAIGRVQNVTDIAKLLHEDILKMQASASSSATLVQERERASGEIKRNFSVVDTQMVELNQDALAAESKLVSLSYLAQTTELLNQSYIKLQQILNYLEELLNYK